MRKWREKIWSAFCAGVAVLSAVELVPGLVIGNLAGWILPYIVTAPVWVYIFASLVFALLTMSFIRVWIELRHRSRQELKEQQIDETIQTTADTLRLEQLEKLMGLVEPLLELGKDTKARLDRLENLVEELPKSQAQHLQITRQIIDRLEQIQKRLN